MIYLAINEFTTPEKEGKLGIMVSQLNFFIEIDQFHVFGLALA
jgi:hypothetical protein